MHLLPLTDSTVFTAYVQRRLETVLEGEVASVIQQPLSLSLSLSLSLYIYIYVYIYIYIISSTLIIVADWSISLLYWSELGFLPYVVLD